jgi:hypothetical protein
MGGGYGFLYRSETRVRIFFKARIFFPEFNIRLYDKNSESVYFIFLHQNQNIFSATLGIRIFYEKKAIAASPLEVKWSVPYYFWYQIIKPLLHNLA